MILYQSMPYKAKPFVKWAGGKSNLLSQIDVWLPHDFLGTREITYVEPFVGGGAMLFHLLRHYPTIKKVVINDINEDLIKCYRLIKDAPSCLIDRLNVLEKEFFHIPETSRSEYYYRLRQTYNSRNEDEVDQAAFFIFLNRTCFNGLYRVNGQSQFNVPFGRRSNVRICDRELLLIDHEILNRVESLILCGSYQTVAEHIADPESTFVYLDPPYLPISVTSYFKQYSSSPFGETEQRELKSFCDSLTQVGCRFVLSNSDCKMENGNSFFEQLYSEYDCHRVYAKRFISAQGNSRGNTSEVLIRNYTEEALL